MHIALWILQLLLAFSFLIIGFLTTTAGPTELTYLYPWTNHVPLAATRAVGVIELLCAAGLVLPAAFRWKPWLTTLSAGVLALFEASAWIFHMSSHEVQGFQLSNVLLFAACMAVFAGRARFAKIPDASDGEHPFDWHVWWGSSSDDVSSGQLHPR